MACAAVTHYRYLEDEIINIGKMNFKLSDESKIPPSVILTPTPVLVDNQSAVLNANNSKPSSRTRHIERRFKYVSEGTKRGRHILLYISNKFQPADIGTKATSIEDFARMIKDLFVKVEKQKKASQAEEG